MMKKSIILILVFWIQNGIAQIPADDPTWQLVFNEDFNTYNSNIWLTRHHMDNGYDAVMLNSNATVQSGNLELTLRREYNYTLCPTQFNYQCNSPSFDFSGAWVESKNENFHYGYYEIKAKMDYRPGFFPAIWLLNSITNPPHYSEIDICEIIGGQKEVNPPNNPMTFNTITNNIHDYDAYNVQNINPTNSFYKEFAINDYRQYHIYGLDWQPNKITWYIDGVQIRTVHPPTPFDVSMRVIFDVHVVKSIAQDPAFFPINPDYPAKMYIDYFKYYQLKGNCSPAITSCNYNFSNHINNTKQSYAIGGTGCSDVVPQNQYYVFRASDFVELKEGFEVPLGSSFLADANPYCNQKNYSTGNCGFTFNPCDYNFSGYVNDVKHLIEISGSGCNAIVQPTDNVQLKAIEYIRLQEGFSVPLGSEIEIKTMLCPP